MAKAIFVIHSMPETQSFQLGDVWYHIPPNEPFEIEHGPFYASKLLEIYGPVYGVMEVPTVKDRTGIHIDVDLAIVNSQNYLKAVDKALLDAYVNEQRVERISKNLPAMPPAGRVAQIIKDRKIDLKAKYNIDIMGMDVFVDHEKVQLKKENEALRNQVAGQDAQLQSIMARMDRMEATTDAPTNKK